MNVDVDVDNLIVIVIPYYSLGGGGPRKWSYVL
jgi:hypothetical protein